LCDASVKGAFVGSGGIEFVPGDVRGGGFKLDVGTAGSVALVLQALMIPATRLGEGLTVSVSGGTDVMWSPPVDYLKNVTLPVLGRNGYDVKLEVEKRGFFPKGGGNVKAIIKPNQKPSPIELTERGSFKGAAGISYAADDLSGKRVVERQMKSARKVVLRGLQEGVWCWMI